MQRRRRVEGDLALLQSLRRRADDLGVLFEWAASGEDVSGDIERGLAELETEVETAETKKMLGGEYDRSNAIVTIHPGAGGTESQDWAEMLLKMYLKWAERRGFGREVMDYQPGDEAGIKSVTLLLSGEYAYGLISAEAGVHRLVRISPFDQAARRHTSFASVFVWPELPEDVDVEIDEKDLRIDTFRSSGAGGPARQRDRLGDPHHAPADRHRRVVPERALAAQEPRVGHEGPAGPALRPEDEGAAGQAGQIGGEKRDIAFGSQIRNYVLQPYQMVKDLRTRMEVGDPYRVLGGDIDGFIKTYLMQKASGTLGTPSAADDD
jgi:peptide chain release factor 2